MDAGDSDRGGAASAGPVSARVIDDLYTAVLVLTDEARAAFASDALADPVLTPLTRVAAASEALKVTTRLIALTTWLLDRRAGLGARSAPLLPPLAVRTAQDRLPAPMVAVIAASEELYDRTWRLAAALDAGPLGTTAPAGARGLMERLERSI